MCIKQNFYLLINNFLGFTMGGATDVWDEIESDGKYPIPQPNYT